jgi:hypothetical protein
MIRIWMILGIVWFFMGSPVLSSLQTMGRATLQEMPLHDRETQNNLLETSNGQLLFLTKFSGVGVCASDLKTFTWGVRFNLAFSFTTENSYVYIWFPKYAHTQWQEWNYTGPETYHAILFLGSVQHINETYIIQGRCLLLRMYSYP